MGESESETETESGLNSDEEKLKAICTSVFDIFPVKKDRLLMAKKEGSAAEYNKSLQFFAGSVMLQLADDDEKLSVGKDDVTRVCRIVADELFEASMANMAKERRKNISEVLMDLSPDGDEEWDNNALVQNIHVSLKGRKVKTSEKAYFMVVKGSKVNFRHKGMDTMKPSRVFLQDLTKHKDKVVVFYSASGSGKTVELAGTGATRGAHLTIILTLNENTPSADGKKKKKNKQEEEEDADIKAREAYAINQFEDHLATFCSNTDVKGVLNRLVQAAEANSEKLKFAVAVDEAATCPYVVRAILRNCTVCVRDVLKKSLKKFISGVDSVLDDEIPVSIGGTGVIQSDIGSFPSSFHVQTPYRYIEGVAELVFDHEMNSRVKRETPVMIGKGGKKVDSFADLQEHLPVVAALTSNGRLGSIAFCKIASCNDFFHPTHEGTLVNEIVTEFMRSNGMKDLLPTENKAHLRHTVAAVALAVQLFLQDASVEVPQGTIERMNFFAQMKFYPLAQSNNVQLPDIVRTYGLLEPSGEVDAPIPTSDNSTQNIVGPLKMTAAQQLVALHMLGIGICGLEDMLRPNPFGFELFSTQLIKAAIAASLAIEWGERPTVQEALVSIGCSDTNLDLMYRDMWAELGEYRAVYSSTKTKSRIIKICDQPIANTFMLSVGLSIVGSAAGEYLVTDRMLQAALGELRCSTKAERKKPNQRFPGVAFVNYGNSPLADGFFIFHACREGEGPEKLTLMNQSKDYHHAYINNTMLRKHERRHRKKVLDHAFGKKRYLVVSSCHESLLSISKPKPYLRFKVDNGKILDSLMVVLRKQRESVFRLKHYATKLLEDGRWDDSWLDQEAATVSNELNGNLNAKQAPKSNEQNGLSTNPTSAPNGNPPPSKKRRRAKKANNGRKKAKQS